MRPRRYFRQRLRRRVGGAEAEAAGAVAEAGAFAGAVVVAGVIAAAVEAAVSVAVVDRVVFGAAAAPAVFDAAADRADSGEAAVAVAAFDLAAAAVVFDAVRSGAERGAIAVAAVLFAAAAGAAVLQRRGILPLVFEAGRVAAADTGISRKETVAVIAAAPSPRDEVPVHSDRAGTSGGIEVPATGAACGTPGDSGCQTVTTVGDSVSASTSGEGTSATRMPIPSITITTRIAIRWPIFPAINRTLITRNP